MAMRSIKARQSRSIGNRCEAIIQARLAIMGVEQVRQIHNGWHIRRGPSGKIVGAAPMEKLDGDLRGLLPPNGRSVLCEVKKRPEKLSHSDLKKHQHDALMEHREHGGVSLVAWVADHGIYIMRYPIEGWKRGTPMTMEMATEASLDPKAGLT